jgi:hypothetical protein
MSDLKLCPFCGTNETFIKENPAGFKDAKCWNCGATAALHWWAIRAMDAENERLKKQVALLRGASLDIVSKLFELNQVKFKAAEALAQVAALEVDDAEQ